MILKLRIWFDNFFKLVNLQYKASFMDYSVSAHFVEIIDFKWQDQERKTQKSVIEKKFIGTFGNECWTVVISENPQTTQSKSSLKFVGIKKTRYKINDLRKIEKWKACRHFRTSGKSFQLKVKSRLLPFLANLCGVRVIKCLFLF